MRLSDIKGERVFDVIADIIEPAVNIATDKDASRMFTREAVPDGMTAEQFAAKKVRECAPRLMRSHKSDIIAIMSAIEGVEPEEYVKDLSLAKLIGDVTAMMTDEDLLAFFS